MSEAMSGKATATYGAYRHPDREPSIFEFLSVPERSYDESVEDLRRAILAHDIHAYLVEHGPTHANVVLEAFRDRWAGGSASLGDMVIAHGRVGYGAGGHLAP